MMYRRFAKYVGNKGNEGNSPQKSAEISEFRGQRPLAPSDSKRAIEGNSCAGGGTSGDGAAWVGIPAEACSNDVRCPHPQ